MEKELKLAVVGATGLVGSKMLEVLEERNFPVSQLYPVASDNSIGRHIFFRGRWYEVISVKKALEAKPDIALFSAGGNVSAQFAPLFAAQGCRVIDNSSFWRMDPSVKLVIPEINADVLTADDMIIANPNCSTIQMLMVVAPLHRRYGIRRIVVSTYQSVTGTGYNALDQMEAERSGSSWGSYNAAYPYPIDRNILPHIDTFLDNGYTKEEMKMVNETGKILNDDSIAVTSTAVRVPVIGGHSEAINLELLRDFELEEVREVIASTPGVVIQDNPSKNLYPMPLYSFDKDEVFVGRIRRDTTVPFGIDLWCVADNLRKGAATNAVQIAELVCSM